MADNDIRDILDMEIVPTSSELTKETILGDKMKKKTLPMIKAPKRPEGMSREVFALLYNDNKDAPPLYPTDTAKGYKQKAKLGMQHARSWKWMPFTNPARTDGAIFHHWRRSVDEGKEYQFAKFNKRVAVPTYTDAEYNQCLNSEAWTRLETDHLLDLCGRFDLRFVVIHDRWDTATFNNRTIEQLKERYYAVVAALNQLRDGKEKTKVYVYDADHETRRKIQLAKLFERTPEQVEEELMLTTELKKIEMRKKDREKKQQDLQKLISAADSQAETRKAEKKVAKKRNLPAPFRPKIDTNALDAAGIKFPDHKTSGISVRSQRMKLPVSVGQKKTKAIEQLLQELGLEPNPIPTEEIAQNFNELRSDMVLLYELKMALSTCEYDMQSLRLQYEALNPGKTLIVSKTSFAPGSHQEVRPPPQPAVDPASGPAPKPSGDIIDVVGSPNSVIF